MRLVLPHGRDRLEVDVEDAGYLGTFTGPPPLADPAAALAEALERPLGYPPLRRALTPEDRLAVLVDEGLPGLAGLLVPLLDHVASAGVSAESVTVLCPTTTAQGWIEALPERHEDIHVEVHDPKDRRKLSYLATTGAGRRIYLNRTAVDADQLVVLSERRYDLRLGYGGAEGAIFPALSDEETLKQTEAVPRTEVPGDEPWPLRREAVEVAWLLGQPFFVQVIASRGGEVAHVLAGAIDASKAGQVLLDQGWKVRLPRRADAAVLTFTPAPRRPFTDLAAAVACAARVVSPGGRIILLTDDAPEPGPGGEILLRADEPRLALAALEKASVAGSAPAVLWAQAAAHARLSVLGGWGAEATEELFATPLADAGQVQRLVAAGGCVVLEDAQRMMAVVE